MDLNTDPIRIQIHNTGLSLSVGTPSLSSAHVHTGEIVVPLVAAGGPGQSGPIPAHVLRQPF